MRDKVSLRRIIVACAFCTFVICLAASIDDCKAQSTPGSISGTVVESFAYTGLAGITVQVFDYEWNYIKSAITDSNGDYSITDLPAGYYYLHTSNTLGFRDEYWHWSTSVPREIRQFAGLITVNAGADTDNMDFALDYGASSISGRIIEDGVGGGIEGITLVVQGSASPLNENIITMVDTDASGNYAVPGLGGSLVYLRTINSFGYVDEYYDNVTSHLDASSLILVYGGNKEVGDWGLVMGGSVSGRVTRASDGAGIPDTTIYFLKEKDSLNSYYLASAVTDSQGYYSIDSIEPDVYYLVARHPDYVSEYYDDALSWGSTGVTVTSGGSVADIDFELEPGGSISGRVTRTSDGSGVRSLSIRVFDENGSFTYRASRTDEQGDYHISGLPAGKYYAPTEGGRIYDYFTYQFVESGVAGEYYSNAARRGFATAIPVVQGQDTGNINFELGNDASISGRITRESNGAALSYVSVRIYDSEWNYVLSDNTDYQGDYGITGLLPGTYYVGTYNTEDYVDEYFGGSTDQSGAVSVTVAYDEDVTGIDIALGEGGSISGSVLSAAGQSGIPDVSVNVFNTAWEPVKSVQTDESGDYSVTGLAAGSYYVLAAANPDYVEEFYPNSVNPSGALPVAVVLGQATADIDFELQAGFGIYGTVTGFENEKAVEGIRVNVYNESWALMDSGTTDALGRYRIEGLAAGRYYVKASGGNGYKGKYCCFSDSQGGAARVFLQYFSREVSFALSEKGAEMIPVIVNLLLSDN